MKPKSEGPLFEEIPYPEYVLRILFASFYPAVRMAVEFNYPLDTVKDMMTLALWREAKRKHSTINLISLIFGKSTRTVKALSARFNKGGFFADTETNLMRRVEDLLRDQPMTFDELASNLPHSNEFDSTQLAVEALLKQDRIRLEQNDSPRKPGQYRVVEKHHDLVHCDDWEARLDALYEHLESVTETIRKRFLSDSPDEASARTFTFRASPEDMEAFRDELWTFMRTRMNELEEKGRNDEKARTYSLYSGMTGREE